jgi:hypothetical protein
VAKSCSGGGKNGKNETSLVEQSFNSNQHTKLHGLPFVIHANLDLPKMCI